MASNNTWKTFGSVGRKILHIVGWTLAFVVLLFVLTVASLFWHPTQTMWLRVGTWFVEQTTGLSVDFDDAYIDVKVMPLLHGIVDVKELYSTNLKFDIADDADLESVVDKLGLGLNGSVGDVRVGDFKWEINEGNMIADSVMVSGADMTVTIKNDTTEEDEEGGFLKKIVVRKVHAKDIDVRIEGDFSLAAKTDDLMLGAMIDLEKEQYAFNDVRVTKLSVRNDEWGKGLSDVVLNVEGKMAKYYDDKLECEGLTLNVESDYEGKQNTLADINAESVNYNLVNGDVGLKGNVNVRDVKALADLLKGQSFADTILQYTTDIPANTEVQADFEMTGQTVILNDVSVSVPSVANVMMKDAVVDMETTNVKGNVTAKVINSRRLLALLPNNVRQNIPDIDVTGMTLNTYFAWEDGNLKLDRLELNDKNLITKIKYFFFNPETEEYDIDADVKNLEVNRFVSVPERTVITGHVRAKGKGFDFLATSTYTKANINLKAGRYGKYALKNTMADIALKQSKLNADINMRDPNVVGDVEYNGTMKKSGINGQLILNVPNADLQALKLADDVMKISTTGVANISTDFESSVNLDAGVAALQILTEKDTMFVDEFAVYANATPNKTQLTAVSGDMDVEVDSPTGYEQLLESAIKTCEVVLEQLKNLRLDVNEWKQYLPNMLLSAYVGQNNPVANFIKLNGIECEEIDVDLSTSAELGIRCEAGMYGLRTQKFNIQNLSLNMQNKNNDVQDSDSSVVGTDDKLEFEVKADIPEQQGRRPFSAGVTGFVVQNHAELDFQYVDEHGDKGIDLGLQAQVEDSVLQIGLNGHNPIIAFKEFEISDSNYIDIHKKNRVFADLNMKSVDDSCNVYIHAQPADDERQMVRAVINNLNMEPIAAVLPFNARFTGLLNGDVAFIEKMDTTFSVEGDIYVDDFVYESTALGQVGAKLRYKPTDDETHFVEGVLRRNGKDVALISGKYKHELEAKLKLTSLPLDMISAFMEDVPISLNGAIDAEMNVKGPADNLNFDGIINPHDVHAFSKAYSLDFMIDNDTVYIANSRIDFDKLNIYSTGKNPITIRGYVDFADISDPYMNIMVTGRNVEIINAPKTRQAELYGKIYGNLGVRAQGKLNELNVTGNVTILNSSDLTYVMTNTALSMGYRLDDIVTFTDFDLPPDSTKIVEKTYSGVDMRVTLTVEDGARMMCVFSADGKSYVDVRGGGTLTLINQKEGVSELLGRYTINEGLMKYANSVIPLKTFNIEKGSFIEFTGEPMNPFIDIVATERVRTSVSNTDGGTRMVTFNTGLKINQTLQNLGLEFTIDAPEDISVQNELAGVSPEEKNKLALSMLATGMYVSGRNNGAFNTTNALNNFLQGEINNIAGKAVSSVLKVDMNLGMEQTVDNAGLQHTDYAFKFSKRLFSDRLNVVVGGLINVSGNSAKSHSGTYIDDVSLEWRLDKSGTQYIRLFHDKDYNNLMEGEVTENGGGIVLRKKFGEWKELWKLFKLK